jgi:hypothetical protein
VNVLLDEDVPRPIVPVIERLCHAHTFDTVHGLGWSGKTDVALYRDARKRKFEVMVSGNTGQLRSPDELEAIRKSGLHVIYYEQGDGSGGAMRIAAGILGSLGAILSELVTATEQTIVKIPLLRANRHLVIDKAALPYWPR